MQKDGEVSSDYAYKNLDDLLTDVSWIGSAYNYLTPPNTYRGSFKVEETEQAGDSNIPGISQKDYEDIKNGKYKNIELIEEDTQSKSQETTSNIEQESSYNKEDITSNEETNTKSIYPVLSLSNERFESSINKYVYTIYNRSGSQVAVYKDTKNSIPYIIRYPNGLTYNEGETVDIPEQYQNSQHKLYFNEQVGTFYFSKDGTLPTSIETLKNAGIIMYVERASNYLYLKYYMIKENDLGYEEDAINLGYDLSIFGEKYK